MKKRIILLEDNADIREIIEYIMRKENIEVLSYNKVAKFLEHTDHSHTHLILLDIMLPDGNGLEICSKLKSESHTTNIPIIMMSAAHNSIDSIYQAHDFISKPFHVDDLVQCVKRHILK